MTVKFFVDTNVLVYTRDASEPEKQKKAMAWMEHLWSTGAGRLSFQVLQEFYVTVTEKLKPWRDAGHARSAVQSLLTWHPVPIDYRVIEGAWLIQDRYRLSWWDALIVSAAQIADCRHLISEDLQDAQEFGKVQVIDPFLRSPASV